LASDWLVENREENKKISIVFPIDQSEATIFFTVFQPTNQKPNLLSLLKCHRDRNAFTWARSKNNRKTHLKKQNLMFNKKKTFSFSFIFS
jgi:hypothetical protein